MIKSILIFVMMTNCLIRSVVCVSSDQRESTSIISKLRDVVNELGCPKGWSHIGGSCYYFPNKLSTPARANQTCNQFHSNGANLMVIDKSIEFFYAAYILKKHNLSTLIIKLEQYRDSTYFSLKNNQLKWKYLKNKFHDQHVKYYRMKENIVDQLESAGLRLSRPSKKIQQTIQKHYPNMIYDPINWDQYEIHTDYNMTGFLFFQENDELDFANEEDDGFERIDQLREICYQINWNITKTNSTIYVLTTSLQSNKTICSMNDIESTRRYPYLCEYVLDYCFANNACGKHGRCINTFSGYTCYCSFLYEGSRCEKISKHGKQIIIGVIILLIVYGLFSKPVRLFLKITTFGCMKLFKKQKKRNRLEQTTNSLLDRPQKISRPNLAKIPFEHNLKRTICVAGLTIFFLSLSVSITLITYLKSFKHETLDEAAFDQLMKDTAHLVAKRGELTDCRLENLIFCSIALVMIFIFSCSIRHTNPCIHNGYCRPNLSSPFEPFRIENRFTTAAMFGIIAYKILNLVEELLFSAKSPLERGVLVEMLEKIALIFLIGLRYYPILASLQFRNLSVRCLACLYLLADIIYTIIREGTCRIFLPLSRYYVPLEEAKLRIEMGRWFMVYGIIKNTPHFLLLSYICAELCVRLVYDSIYLPIRNKRNLCRTMIVTKSDDYIFAKSYVTNLFRRTSLNYQWDNNFRFTTLVLCAFTVASVFIYYLSCTLVFVYISRTTNHASFIKYTIERIFQLEFQEVFSLRTTIIISGLTTLLIYVYHLFTSLKNYKLDKIQLLQGIKYNIPPMQNFTYHTVIITSIRYFGYLAGYMLCGFLVWFHLTFIVLLTLRIIALKIPFIEFLFASLVPVLIIYLIIGNTISAIGTVLFAEYRLRSLNLTHPRIYVVFMYFTFLFDCLLGIVSCFIRLIKGTFLNLIFMARLDLSFHGRSLEKWDAGFKAYVTYLHMEVAHTNPIIIAFCNFVYEDICARRRRRSYDVPCCISSNEANDSPLPIESRESQKSRQARFRWFLIYTLICNPTLFDHRKNFHQRVIYIFKSSKTNDLND